MPITPFDEAPPKPMVATHSTGSLTYLKDQFVQGIYLSDDKIMFSNFAKMYSTLGDKGEQLNFGSDSGVTEDGEIAFSDEELSITGEDYLNME